MEDIREQIGGKAYLEKKPIFMEHDVIWLLVRYLKKNGWRVRQQVRVGGGSIDILAEREGKIFLIEAKGEDKGGPISVEMNFQNGLGQLMSRMKHLEACYGLAFPLTQNFAKVLSKYQDSFAFEKLGIYLIPVKRNGSCRLVLPTDAMNFIRETAAQ